LECEYCRVFFEIDLLLDRINPVLRVICPDCLSKIQRGDLHLKETVQQEAPTTDEWFT
jgi:hypothetical protein